MPKCSIPNDTDTLSSFELVVKNPISILVLAMFFYYYLPKSEVQYPHF